jgi:hypothetical protein
MSTGVVVGSVVAGGICSERFGGVIVRWIVVEWWLCVVDPLTWMVFGTVGLGVVLPLAPGFPLGGVVFVVV